MTRRQASWAYFLADAFLADAFLVDAFLVDAFLVDAFLVDAVFFAARFVGFLVALPFKASSIFFSMS